MYYIRVIHKEMGIVMKDKKLGQTLRDYRKASRYTVQQIVDILQKEYNIVISPKTLYGWENGQNQPSADNLLILCRIYKITNILETFGYEGVPEQTPLILSNEEREIILKYRSRKYCNSAIRKLLDIPD